MGALDVVQQGRVSLTQSGTQRAHQAALLALSLLCLDQLTPAVQHLDLLTLQLLPQIIRPAGLAGAQLPLEFIQQLGLLPHLQLPLLRCQLLHHRPRLYRLLEASSGRFGASSAPAVSSPVDLGYPPGWGTPAPPLA